MKTMLWQHVEHLQLMVLVHSESPPTDAEWDLYCARLHVEHPSGLLRRILVFCDGPGPTVAQRRKLQDRGKYGDKPPFTAVVTHGIIARSIVSALSWLYDIRSYAPAELDDAFRYLSIPDIEWYMLRRIVATLRVQLTASATISSSPEVTDMVGRLDELVTDRLPKLRSRLNAVARKTKP